MKRRFQIIITRDFEDTENMPAGLQAEDWAYTITDKSSGSYIIKEVRDK